MRISFLIPCLHYDGISRWALDLCRQLRHVQVESIITRGELVDPQVERQFRGIAPVKILPFTKDEKGVHFPERECRQAIEEGCGKADALIVCAFGLLPRLVDQLRHCARIVVSHVTPEWEEQAKLVLADAAAATHCVAVSKAAAACFTEESTIIESGVDPARVIPVVGREKQRQAWKIPQDAKVALYLGRFHQIKQQGRLLDALHHLSDDWYAVFAGCAGPKDQQDTMAIRAEEEHPGRVRFLSASEHIGDYLAAADCLVITSKAESGPLVMHEAMLAGVPVVTTEFQAAMDVINRHAIISIVVPQNETAQRFAEMIEVSQFDKIRNTIHPRQVALDNYTSPAMAHRWETFLLNDVLDWHKRRTEPEPIKIPEVVQPPEINWQPRRADKPKVVFLMPSIQSMGGVESWLKMMVEHSDLDWSVANLTTRQVAPPDLKMLESLGCPYSIDDTSICQDADLVIAWGVPQARRWLRGYAGPLCLVSHGSNDWTRRWVQALEPYAQHFVGVSKQAAAVFSGKAEVIHNGIDARRLELRGDPEAVRAAVRKAWGIQEGEYAVGFLGRISDEKNPLLIARACKALGSHFRPIFAGRDVTGGRLGKEIEKNSKQVFVRPTEQVGEVYAALDCVVVSSPAEGFSLVTVEALYAGTPLVSTPVGILPEIEEEWGQVATPIPLDCTPGQASEAIVAALRRKTVAKGQQAAKVFTAEKMGREWEEFICRVAVTGEVHA